MTAAAIWLDADAGEQFTAETGIEVNVVTTGANYEETSQRFQTAQGSTEVGVVVLSDATWFPNYLNGSLVAVDDLLEEADIDTSGYVEALYEDYLYEGSHYGVPYARSTPLFYYNADHYAEAGIVAPGQIAPTGAAVLIDDGDYLLGALQDPAGGEDPAAGEEPEP